MILVLFRSMIDSKNVRHHYSIFLIKINYYGIKNLQVARLEILYFKNNLFCLLPFYNKRYELIQIFKRILKPEPN